MNEMTRAKIVREPRHRRPITLAEAELVEREFASYLAWCDNKGYQPSSTRSALAYEEATGFFFIGGK